MKVHKPPTVAALYRTLRFGGRDLLSIGALAMFRFGETGVASLAQEAQLWRTASAVLGADEPLDTGWPKPCGEYLVYGKAFANAGTSVGQLAIDVAVGTSKKTLFVFGDRQFNALGQISAPAPFTSMPLDATRAYGGPGFADNPRGIGAISIPRPDGSRVRPLPNLEAADALILGPGDQRAPARFGALPASTPARAQLLGRFDERWLATQWPHLPDGTQTDYFCSAPRDQRIDGFWLGDEAISMRNLHPKVAALRAQLPALRARCFVRRRAAPAAAARFEECAARAETVWLFPESECGIVLYRAVAEITDEDADDVLDLMLEWEPLAAPPLSEAVYRERLLQTLESGAAAPADASKEVTPPAEFKPPPSSSPPASSAPPFASVAAPAVLPAEMEADLATLQTQIQSMLKQHGLTEAQLDELMPREAASAAATPAAARDELNAALAQIERETTQLLASRNLTIADAERLLPAAVAQPETNEAQSLGAALRDISASVKKLVTDNRLDLTSIAKQTDDPELAALIAGGSLDPMTRQIEELEARVSPPLPSLTPLKPVTLGTAQGRPAAPAAPAVAPRLTRDDVIARHAAGVPLRGQDLSGLDLSALDLIGADFSDALLAGTRFTGGTLSAARFDQALLREADFTSADLRAASFQSVSANGARFANANLDGAVLDLANFTDADFSSASLMASRCSATCFAGARMQALRAAGCDASGANFFGCTLAQADFSSAQLGSAQLDRASITGARFDNARCAGLRLFATEAAGARFDGADLSGSRAGLAANFTAASLRHTTLERANWIGVDLRDAVFDDSALRGANFGAVQASGASFARVDASAAQFDKADLRGAVLHAANLAGASLRRAQLDGAQLQASNLYGAQCYGSTIGRAQLDDANLDRTLLQIDGRAEAKR